MIVKSLFGVLKDGREVAAFDLYNRSGCRVRIIELGATVAQIFVPDRNGVVGDVVLGQDTLEECVNNPLYLGSIMGRIANIVGGSSFQVNGQIVRLEKGDYAPGIMHCGTANYAYRLFRGTITGDKVEMYLEDQGEGGFGTTVKVWVMYSFNDENQLKIEYITLPMEDTAVNLTSHIYFNLGKHLQKSVLDTLIRVDADYYTADVGSEPLGIVHSVKGSENDFRELRPMRTYITGSHTFYNTSYVIRGRGFRSAAYVMCPDSGRTLKVSTDLPGLMFFGAGSVGIKGKGKSGLTYEPDQYFCLETQFFPDSVNQPHFVSPFQKKNTKYHFETVYQFGLN